MGTRMRNSAGGDVQACMGVGDSGIWRETVYIERCWESVCPLTIPSAKTSIIVVANCVLGMNTAGGDDLSRCISARLSHVSLHSA